MGVNKFLYKTANFSGYALILLMSLYFVSGYGMTKAIIDPVLAKMLHDKWLPLPTIIFFVLHVFLHLRFRLNRWFKNKHWLNIYILILSLVVLALLLYLYLL